MEVNDQFCVNPDAETRKQWTEFTSGPSLALLSFNIYKQLHHDIKTCTLYCNAWKQKYELSLMQILV